MIITRLLEKWFNLEPVVCKSCEILKWELEQAHAERKRLLDMLTNFPQHETKAPPSEPVLPRRNIPWSVRQQMLEAEDRKKAELMKQKTEELEKEVLGNAS